MEAEHSDRPTDRDTNSVRGSISLDRPRTVHHAARSSFAPMTLHVAPALIPTQRTCLSTYSMMAKKKPPSKGMFGKAKSGGGGFGAAPPPPATLEEVVAGWPTRLPADNSVECPCGSGDSYADCCRPYHLKEKTAESPERCLRTRYSAFAHRLPIYIIDSTDQTNGDYQKDRIKWARRLNKEQMFDSFQFVNLEIGDAEDGSSDTEKFLSLRVTLQPIDPVTKMKAAADPLVFSERSKFLRNKAGTWLYAAGEVRSEAIGFKDRTLKDEKDLAKMEKDVEYVNKLIKKKTGGN